MMMKKNKLKKNSKNLKQQNKQKLTLKSPLMMIILLSILCGHR